MTLTRYATPFMQGGKIRKGDTTIRNEAGFPINENGDIDTTKAVMEAVTMLKKQQTTPRGSNRQPAKKKRK